MIITITISAIAIVGWVAYFKKTRECNEVEYHVVNYLKEKM